MKTVTRRTGVLTIIGRSRNNGKNGSPRLMIKLGDCIYLTRIDSREGYTAQNYHNKIVTADTGTHYGTPTIENIELVKG